MGIETLTGPDLKAFADQVVESWGVRDELISRIATLRKQTWKVQVPPAWEITAKTQHSSLPLDIATRVPGVLCRRDPVWFRTPPSEDGKAAERANTVTRFLTARHQYEKRAGIPGKNAYQFQVDQLVNKGAACVGVLYAPHAWAASPAFSDDSGKPMSKWWRDKKGKPTEDEEARDAKATAAAYNNAVDEFRRRAKPPITRRYLPTEQCYPAFVGNQMAAMVIKRKTNPLDLEALGFETERFTGTLARDKVSKELEVTEVWLPDSYHFFYGGEELIHRDGNEDGGVETRYGFVPYSYQSGIEGGDLEYGSYGLPLLALVESNIKMIDTLLTFRYNAIHMASFTSWYMKYDGKDSDAAMAVALTADGQEKTYTFQSGTITDWGPGKHPEPFIHPGLNKDFDRALADERAEVRKLIPDVMLGKAAGSGYEDALLTEQAMAMFDGIQAGNDILMENTSILEMRHIAANRPPGPIYIDLAEKDDEFSRGPSKVSRISIQASDIDDYYGILVTTERATDIITQGTYAVQVHAAGHMDRKWVHKMVGGTDYEASERQRRIDEFMARQDVKDVLAQQAIHDYGLDNLAAEAAARAQIVAGSDGTPMVQMADGSMAGPGQQAPQLPVNQGGVGAMLGGPNMAAPGPNLASTANPQIAQPTAEQPNRFRRRGGIPGAPQRQGMTKPGQ